MEKRTKPYTNREFFAELCARVDLPRILDYSLASSKTVEIKSYECNFWNSLNYGTSEGIYLDIGLEFRNPERTVIPLGTFKTLEDNQGAMWEMARLLADLIYTTFNFMNEHLDDFDWVGYRVRGIEREATTSYAVSYTDITAAMEEILKVVDAYPCVQLYDCGKHEYSYFRKDTNGALAKYKTMEECLQNGWACQSQDK